MVPLEFRRDFGKCITHWSLLNSCDNTPEWKPQEKEQEAKAKKLYYWEILQLLLLMIQIKHTDDAKIRMVGDSEQ